MKWRAQISANGKTTSLGDHDTEEQAATAFDRAAINKGGKDAKTNFPIGKYADEIPDLQAMDLEKLVAMLRSKARKSGTQTSHFRGVSLLKQTARWHAQINVGGKQVHLGFFPSEEYAARAYDRASINKGAKETGGKITTNFEVSDYGDEIDLLRRISQTDLVGALSTEMKRKQAMAAQEGGPPIVGTTVGKKPVGKVKVEKGVVGVEELMGNAQRAQPKSTLRNPLYQDFGIKKQEGTGSSRRGQASAPAAPGSKNVVDQEQELPEDRMIAAAMLQCREGFDRLLAGANLPSLANGPILELPLVHPMTGAPILVAGPLDSHASAGPVFVTPGPQPKSKVREFAKTPKKGAAGKSVEAPKTPAGKGERPRNAAETRQRLANQTGDVAMASPPRRGAGLGAGAAGSSSRHLWSNQAPSGKVGLEPSTPPMSPIKQTRRANQGDLATTPRSPPAKRKRGNAKEDPGLTATALLLMKNPPKTPKGRATAPPISPVTPPAAHRTGGGTLPGSGWRMAGAEEKQPVMTLQERLREQLVEHQRQNAERARFPADNSPQDPTPVSTGRPLTKRQEALAIRKTEEAAATLAGGPRQSPHPATDSARQTTLPEEVGHALMDFAAAAELAEIEDRRQDEADIAAARRVHRGRASQDASKARAPVGTWLADLLKNLPAASGDTASTVSDPETMRRSAGHLQEAQSSKRARV